MAFGNDADDGHDEPGVFTGAWAENPVNKERIPIYAADYVLYEYGTGIVMGVPAHDARDFDFAKNFEIDIHPVIDSPEMQKN